MTHAPPHTLDPNAALHERSAALGAPLAARLEAALDKVERALALPDATEMIHDARKAIKEYRALLRIIGSEDAKAARRGAAQAARELSGSRDRQACKDALADMKDSGHLGEEDAARALEAVARDGDGSESAASHVQTLRNWLTEARANHAAVLDAQASSADILSGVSKAYAKARSENGFGAADEMHELRKRVVTHRYQMSFLADLSDGAGAARARRVQGLRDVLGMFQDIETLRDHLEKAGEHLADDVRQRTLDAAESRQKALRRKARRLHAELFRRKPKAFARKLSHKVAPDTPDEVTRIAS